MKQCGTDMKTEKLSEKTGISVRVIHDIREVSEKNEVRKIVLFGSRARGTHHPKSDIDLAVYGCEKFLDFSYDIEEKAWTLLEFDLIDMEQSVSEDLKEEIERDGIVIYEKV